MEAHGHISPSPPFQNIHLRVFKISAMNGKPFATSRPGFSAGSDETGMVLHISITATPDHISKIYDHVKIIYKQTSLYSLLKEKIASDWRKPDGQFVIQPVDIDTFLPPLPVGRLPGVGKVMEEKLKQMGVSTVGDLRGLTAVMLEQRFGRYGLRLHNLSLGIDHSEVKPDRPIQSISAEDTFAQDVLITELDSTIRSMAEKTWRATRKTSRVGRTVVLKLKTADFRILTRSHTPPSAPSSCEVLTEIALSLLQRVDENPTQRYRLVGVGLGNFSDADEVQTVLFE